MIIVYYTDENGKIVNHYRDDHASLAEAKERAEEYSACNPLHLTVHVVEVEDDGLTAYLFKKEEALRIEYDKEITRDITSNLLKTLEELKALLVKNTEG